MTKTKCPGCGHRFDSQVAPGLEGACPACLAKFAIIGPEEDIDQIRALFPNVEIVERLGRGGMGVVYKARQPNLDRFVALKILPPSIADPEFVERFNREAKALARLSHPNIVGVYDFGRAGEFFWLMMEFVDGADLRSVLREARLKPEQAFAIVPQLCDALEYAHGEGVVHRDIKPENILVDKRGRVKIADFGLAKIFRGDRPAGTLTQTDAVMGTPHYMAPEQVENTKSVDHRADIYSMGVVFYEMLTGELPIGRFQPPSRMVHVDVRLDEVVLKTLEKEPARRYQHAVEVKDEVTRITTTKAVAPVGDRPRISWSAIASPFVAGVSIWFGMLWAVYRGNPHALMASMVTGVNWCVFLLGAATLCWTGFRRTKGGAARGRTPAAFGLLLCALALIFPWLPWTPKLASPPPAPPPDRRVESLNDLRKRRNQAAWKIFSLRLGKNKEDSSKVLTAIKDYDVLENELARAEGRWPVPFKALEAAGLESLKVRRENAGRLLQEALAKHEAGLIARDDVYRAIDVFNAAEAELARAEGRAPNLTQFDEVKYEVKFDSLFFKSEDAPPGWKFATQLRSMKLPFVATNSKDLAQLLSEFQELMDIPVEALSSGYIAAIEKEECKDVPYFVIVEFKDSQIEEELLQKLRAAQFDTLHRDRIVAVGFNRSNLWSTLSAFSYLRETLHSNMTHAVGLKHGDVLLIYASRWDSGASIDDKFTVQEDGTITLPGLGKFAVAGKTPELVRWDLNLRLGDQLKNFIVERFKER